MKKVIVGLSGGVDSSVAALLLKNQNYKVIGIFIRNWYDKSININECSWLEDSTDAMLVAHQLKIPFQIIDTSTIYKKYIINYIYKKYSEGKTPNPDILCNKIIKFNIFIKAASSLRADFIATGHYARCIKFKNCNNETYHLLSGIDKKKDQSYFLCQLNQKQLSRVIFPIGSFKKIDVRKIAEKEGLITAKKKDSQGLCFIGKIKIKEFLKKKLKPKRGDIIKIPIDLNIYKNKNFLSLLNEKKYSIISKKYNYNRSHGKIIGKHLGAFYFTKGQRKGLGIGGYNDRLFVIDTDIKNNIVYVGMGKNHPGLYKKAIFIKEKNIHWIQEKLILNKEGEILKIKCRIRHGQELQSATLYKVKKGIYIIFNNKQISISEGQFAAWYINEEIIGSGVISY